jgi:O-antigen/teichoic acid export membrane protein
MRFLMSAGLFVLLGGIALAGPWLVGVLYDARYEQAGAILVLVACALLPQAIGLSYDRAALAAGDSRGAFAWSAIRSSVQMGFLYAGFAVYGLLGGLAGMGIALALVHPVLIRLARRHHAWDALHDAVFAALALAITLAAVWLHAGALRALAPV